MRLTRKKAIELCDELWTWLAKTGKDKEDWPGWEKYGKMAFECPFCEYGSHQAEIRDSYMSLSDACPYCPFEGKGFCRCNSLYFSEWKMAKENENITARKKYAKLFLEQIKTLK